MATRADYRTELQDKIIGLEDSGYGDFEWTDTEYNTYLDLAVARLFPALYKRMSQTSVLGVSYGTAGFVKLTVNDSSTIYRVETSDELEPVLGWQVVPGEIRRILSDSNSFNVYYYDAYALPADDVTDAGIPARWKPLVVLGALIECLESRQDTGVRPDPANNFPQTTLLDRLTSRYNAMRDELALSLPVLVV